jgi:LysM repeat protein
LAGFLYPASGALASPPRARAAQSGQVTAYDLIIAMNTLRVSYGHRALVEDPIVNAVAQATAEYMAANHMSWHIGDVRGRIAAAGYGGGGTVWATENFAAASNWGIDEIMQAWADPSHMLPATNPAYCNVGAGVAKSDNGRTYYVLQAAYVSGKSCGSYASPPGSGTGGGSGGVPQIIIPVKIATPDADGKIFHVVQAGQSFWAIAVAYKITIKDLEIWNNLSRDSKLQIGQRLFIPGPNTEGYSTPTPVGMILASTPGPDGKVIHIVQAYNTLSTISKAYGVKVDAILALNGIQVDWPLQIGQKLLIHPGNVTPSPTPRPLSAVEKLTPASDGKYYHIIQSGETLSWIALLYDVNMFDLMAWNGLNETSIIKPEQKLVLQVTPPATMTPTPAPATATPTATVALPTHTPTLAPTQPPAQAGLLPTVPTRPAPVGAGIPLLGLVFLGLAAGALLVGVLVSRRKQARV